jgi:N-succinyldiaminopimelate aminotransferase
MSERAYRSVPKTGVIYVTSEAQKRGFTAQAEDWCNLGQGMPETEELAGAPPRLKNLEFDPADFEYAPVGGKQELRQKVADFYNEHFRRGKASQYTWENVAISGGGRASLTRIVASLGNINLGHFLPDYTAYEELLDIFSLFIKPIPILLNPDQGYAFTAEDLRREVRGMGLAAILLSNPSNPTGKTVTGEELEAWLQVSRDEQCALIFDEFYSHYIWDFPDQMFSAASHVKDVEKDDVIIVDGLTKNWRYPGFRTTWTLAPKKIIDAVISAGSFLDGGGTAPLQSAAVDMLEPDYVASENRAIQDTFLAKRNFLLQNLKELGVHVPVDPRGSFYIFGSVENLPEPLNTGEKFFRQSLERKVIVVPGNYFDVNPGQRRFSRHSRFHHFVRFSYGPSMQKLEMAVDRLREMIKAHS